VRRSKVEVYLHFVWAVSGRRPLLTPEVERAVYACILNEAGRRRCEVLALGGTSDHVHLAVQFPSTVTLGEFMKQVKGVSSRMVETQFGEDLCFVWQEGYGVFSFSRPHKNKIIAYVQNQKCHHEENHLWPQWEEVDEETPSRSPSGGRSHFERGISIPRKQTPKQP